jgi:hypothetical protein
VSDNRFGEPVWNIFDFENGFDLAAVLPKAVVVELRVDIHTSPAQRQEGIVKVKQIRIMLVDEVAGAVVKVLHIGCVGQCSRWVLHAIEPLRIEALPPLIFAFRLGEMAIIHAKGYRPSNRRGSEQYQATNSSIAC